MGYYKGGPRGGGYEKRVIVTRRRERRGKGNIQGMLYRGDRGIELREEQTQDRGEGGNIFHTKYSDHKYILIIRREAGEIL